MKVINKPNVCIVTVTYGDRAHLLRQVIDALSILREAERITMIIVVDNGSSPATQEYWRGLGQCGPRAKIIHLTENTGSAAGFKAGLEAALETDCDYIWLLDDDNKPGAAALSSLLKAVRGHSDKAAFVSLRTDRPSYIRYAKNGDWAACFGRPNGFLGFSWRDIPRKIVKLIGHSEDVMARPHLQPRIVPYAPYGGLFLKRNQLKKIGLPREDFYLYADDFELTYRLTKVGVSIYLIPESILIDIDASWHVKTGRNARSYFLSPFILTAPDASKMKRLYYSLRNGVYFETTSLGVNPLEYRLNGALHLSMLGLVALTGAISRFNVTPLQSYYTLLRAARDGFQGKLGRLEDQG